MHTSPKKPQTKIHKLPHNQETPLNFNLIQYIPSVNKILHGIEACFDKKVQLDSDVRWNDATCIYL